jgi:hypothetical protein
MKPYYEVQHFTNYPGCRDQIWLACHITQNLRRARQTLRFYRRRGVRARLIRLDDAGLHVIDHDPHHPQQKNEASHRETHLREHE